MQNLDLTASKWASPDVRRERESQIPAWTRAAPSPYKQDKPLLNAWQQPQKPQPPPLLSTPALSTKPVSSAQRRYLSRQAELQRFRRLFRRLAWKANSLTHWSHRALNLAQEHQSQRHQNSNSHAQSDRLLDEQWAAGPRATLGPYDLIIDPVDAERQFKIDFYEFYALLERGLVCLLGVWGVVITASAAATAPMAEDDSTMHSSRTRANGGTSGSQPIIGDSLYFQGAAHRFHANVLAALDHPANPLHLILGTGPVREYIGVAKEFRNKWKDVESRPEDSFRGPERAEEEWDPAKMRRYEKVLRDLKLEEMLGSVLRGLEEAGKEAEAEIERLESSLGGASKSIGARDVDFDMQDAPFEVMDRQGDLDYEMEF